MPLKTDPKYGHYPWWPEEGDAWVHPADVELARELIPSERIFCRDGTDAGFAVLHYGQLRLRVKPALWQEVTHEGFDIGDWVEVLSRGQLNTPRTGVIREMLWNAHDRAIEYEIADNGVPIPTRYRADDLRPVEPTPPLGAD